MDDDSVLGALPTKLAAREVAVEAGDISHRLDDDYVTRMAEGLDLDQRDEGPQ